MPLPFTDGARVHVGIRTGQVGRYAELGVRFAGAQNLLHQFVVAVGGLNKELRLLFAICPLLQHFQLSAPLIGLNRQVAIEGKALSIEARGHHRQDDGRGAY